MLEINEYEGKTLEDVKQKALIELNASENEVIINHEFIEGKLFKASKYKINVIKITDIKKFIESYLKELGKLMNINIETEINVYDQIFNVMLVSDNNSILIGKEGKNIESLQLIIRQVLKNKVKNHLKINLDVSNYKANKMKKLEYEIKKIAKEVQSTKIDASLDPMNSYERRNIHTMIDKFDNLVTESIGEGKDRHIVIKYVESKK